MGKDKAELCLHGKTFLQHTQHILEDAGVENIYISHPKRIADVIPGYGPLSGIHAILQHVQKQHSHLLFLPVDMPSLTRQIIKRLINAPPQAELVHYAAYRMPFRLNTDKQWFELADRLLRKGSDVSLGGFQLSISDPLVLETDTLNRQAFCNINTQAQWQALNQQDNLL